MLVMLVVFVVLVCLLFLAFLHGGVRHEHFKGIVGFIVRTSFCLCIGQS